MLKTSYSHKYYALLLFTILTIIFILFIPRIPQNISYHDFADKRSFFGVSYFINDFSNIFFLIVGYTGLYIILAIEHEAYFNSPAERWPYVALFIGSILTGLGSAYYHLNPTNITLFWDRLPMSIISMSYFSAIFIERVNKRLGLFLLIPLIFIGMVGTWHWVASEMVGQGDLRFYGWTQFYPISMIFLVLMLFPPTYTGTYYILESFAWYTIAKLGEYFDNGVYLLTLHTLSGHTLKHLAAAIGIYSIVRYLKYRKALILHTNKD